MTLDKETLRYRKSQADRVIRDLLTDRLEPSTACTSQKIARVVFPEWVEMSNQQWGSAISFTKRAMGGMRQRAYSAIETQGIKPTFFPFPFAFSVYIGSNKKERYFAYFNAVQEPWFSRAITRMEGAGDGLIDKAGLLRSVTNNGNCNGDDGQSRRPEGGTPK
jgi:hypothetical protein